MPPPQSSLFFLCITSSCLPADVENFLCSPLPPFSGQPGCHGNCILLGLGVERVGSRGEEMVMLDSGLCLSPCFCFCISSPHPCPTPSHHRCLGTRGSCQRSSSAFSSLGSLSPSRVSLTLIAVSPPSPGSPSLQLLLLLPLGWLPFRPQPGQALISRKVRGRPGLVMPISPQGSRSWRCVHPSLSGPPPQAPPHPQLPWKGSTLAAPLQTCLPPV